MVRDSVIYPVILEKLEDEIAIIKQGGFYMPDIHIGSLTVRWKSIKELSFSF
jgi:hypothetical protein